MATVEQGRGINIEGRSLAGRAPIVSLLETVGGAGVCMGTGGAALQMGESHILC